MKKFIAGGLLGVLGAMLFASSALGASHNPKGEYATFNYPPGPDEDKNKNESKIRRLITIWWPSSNSKTPNLLRAASVLIEQYGKAIKFHLVIRDKREPISLRQRVITSFANQLAAVNSAISSPEGGSRLVSANEPSPGGQDESIWNRLSNRGELRPFVAPASSCA